MIEVDPSSVYVEEAELERARSFARADEFLGELEDDDMEACAGHIAEMTTALSCQLLLSDPETMALKSISFTVGEDFDKTIVVVGTKKETGVDCEACVLDTAKANELLGYEE